MVILGIMDSRKKKAHSVVLRDDLTESFSLLTRGEAQAPQLGTSDGWVGLGPEGWHGKERKSSPSRGQGTSSEAGLVEEECEGSRAAISREVDKKEIIASVI